METIISISNFLILGLILILPVYLLIVLKRRSPNRIAIKYFLIGIFLMAILISIFAAWIDISSLMLLNHYGYSVDGMNYDNVLPENRERVDGLVASIMGIGWPVKAMFGFVIFIPYLIVVYFMKKLIEKMKENRNEA